MGAVSWSAFAWTARSLSLSLDLQALRLLSGTPFPRTQPEGDLRGLHRLLHNRHEVLTHVLQIYLLAQCGAECGERLLGIIFLAIEAPINERLQTPPHGQDERGYRQRRDDQHDWIMRSRSA